MNRTRAFAFLTALAGLVVAVVSLVDHGFHHWGWRPQIVGMIALAIANFALVLGAFVHVRENRRKKSRHA